MLVIITMLATAGVLASEVAVMVTTGDLGQWASMQWMTWRVGLQAVAFLLTLIALLDLR